MKTVIFDFGNVVGFFDHGRTLRRLQEYTDMPAEEMLATIYAGSLEDDFEAGRISEVEFLEAFLKGCRLRCSSDVLAELCADIFWPNPEICDLIPKLKPRYQILLGSNTNVLHSGLFKKQFADVLQHFDALVLSHDIGVRKPKPEFFQYCQSLALGRPDECIFLDDLAVNVESARRLGWKGIVYRPDDGVVEKLHDAGIQI